MHYLDSLNTEQKKAVLATDGPVLIVAGAGAGKTKTITHRILHLMHTGISPDRILAITFTNKAAKEMRERVELLMQLHDGVPVPTLPTPGALPAFPGNQSGAVSTMSMSALGRPHVSTFHSLGVRIIKENAPLLNLQRHFSIFDTSDSKKVIKDAMVHIGVDPKEHLDKVRHIISGEKGRGVTLSEYLERGSYDYTSELVKKVWTEYEKTLTRESALDFDDLLLKTLKLLEKNSDVLERYQDRFQYIHIDEYQDTNKVQNTIVELIGKKHGNLCVVGDTDQNIYSWRGAEIKNMLHFEKKYPDVQTIFLEQNYRSTKTILSAANSIIEKNKFRIPKKLFTENGTGEKIALFEGRNETDEAHFIALTSKKIIENGASPEEIAVLYRANFQSRVLEDAFLAYGVPYQMLGTKFFERKEIKDVVAYIKAALNEVGASDFTRIINIPPRGIGKVTLEKIVNGQEHELPASAQIKINKFREMLVDFRKFLTTQVPSEAIKHIIRVSGIEQMYKTGLEEDTERLENVMELVTLATGYDLHPLEEGIEKFLTDVSLASDQDSLEDGKGGVRLMTVHSSKGLEFEYVFISGLEADLFPHTKMNRVEKSGEESEEERRLFYVALTRAKKKLYLTHAQTRTIFGSMEVNSPSEFINDIPKEYVEKEGYDGEPVPKPYFSINF